LFKLLFNWLILLLITFSWVVPGWETSVMSIWFFKFGKNFSLKKKWLDVNKNVVRYNHRFQLHQQWIHKQTLAQTAVNLIAIRFSTWTGLIFAQYRLNLLYAGVKVTPSSKNPRLWLNNSNLAYSFIGETVQCGNGRQQLMLGSCSCGPLFENTIRVREMCPLIWIRIQANNQVTGKKSLRYVYLPINIIAYKIV
jgi:hypothetical protein